MNKTLQALLMFSLLIYLSTVGLIQFICGLVLVLVCEIADYIAWSRAHKNMKEMLAIMNTLTEELSKDNKKKKTTKPNTKNKKKGE